VHVPSSELGISQPISRQRVCPQPWMKELKGIIHRGEGAFLRCPVSTSVQFSLHDEGSTEYMCVRGKITGDNIYRCQSACPVVLNDFDLFKENTYNISEPVMGAKLNFNTHLPNIMFDFFSYLSAGPNLFYCTETLVLCIR
jgi:hypothetical protein